MRALYLNAPRELSLAEVPTPELGPGDMLLRVRAATTCGTDLKAFRRGHPQIPMPGPFGHEYSGVVEAASGDAPFSVGDAVMGVHSGPCQTCYWCRNGQENLCESIMETKVLGSFAEFLLIPARIARLNVFRKPEGLPFEQAALLEPLACVAQGMLELEPSALERVLVIGPGAIGLMFVAALRAVGVSDVTLAGRNRERLAVGERFGARTATMEEARDPGRGYDAVIECTGAPEVWEHSVDFVRRGGRVMLFGGLPSGTRVSWDAGRLHYDQITLLSPFHFGTEAVRLAHKWLVVNGIDLSELISGERSLSEADAVFAALEAGEGIKYVFKP
ncbi:MAG TPA: alcohol dehydrogenase catalytic domain-containing protein [Fimbriimonadaceae bacterium]|nr:alcohol dehydrogenase catalytic domain-containing protein [Fimbriimonadaceae bacterium]